MAGETHAAHRDIGRSVVIASPVIFLMFVLGTASVLSVHELHMGTPINYVAPIPQTLALAFGSSGAAALVARFAILLLQIRILGAASFIFTGVVRLPMAAGWDHLVPRVALPPPSALPDARSLYRPHDRGHRRAAGAGLGRGARRGSLCCAE